jgi:hypothetical protein
MLTTLTQQIEEIKALVPAHPLWHPFPVPRWVLTPNPIAVRNMAATLRPKKTHCPTTCLLSFWRKLAKWPHRLKFLAIPRFSLKEFIKVRPWRRRGGVVTYRHKSGYFKIRKNSAPTNQYSFFSGEKSTLPQKSSGEISPFPQIEFIKVRPFWRGRGRVATSLCTGLRC